MVLTGLLISFFLGYIWLQIFFNRITFLEKIAGAFLLGLALQTMVMAVLDMLGMRIALPGIFIGTAILGLIPIGFALFQNRSLLNPLPAKITMPKISLVWILFFAVVAYMEYMNFQKCVYFPTFDRDSIAGFESIGYAIAQEQCIAKLSLFDVNYQSFIHGPASYITYMPFTQLSYAYVYLLGAEISKIINALMFLSFIILFYAQMRRVATETISIIITLFVIATPELMSWSSMSMTNVIQAIFASIGVIYGLLWIKDQRSEDLYLSAIFMALNLWSRNEGLAIVAALGAVLLLRMLFVKKWKLIIPWATIVLVPFIVWTVYMKVAGMWSESIIITKPFWDAEKFGVMWERFVFLMQNRQYYGYSFDAFALFAIANAYFIWKKKHLFNAYTLLCVVAFFVIYFILIYQVNYVWDSIENVLNYSVKRYFFCFIPILWFFVGTSYLTDKFGTWLDKFQFGK